MMKYRLSFYGLSGFDTKGFGTKEEAIAWAKEQGSLGLATPDKLMKYDKAHDIYKTIGKFIRK